LPEFRTGLNASGKRLTAFVEQTKTIFFFFMLGDKEQQAKYTNGLFELLTEREKADMLADLEKARGEKPDAV